MASWNINVDRRGYITLRQVMAKYCERIVFDEDVPLCLSNVDNALVICFESCLAGMRHGDNNVIKMQTAILLSLVQLMNACFRGKRWRSESLRMS